mgnify:FL=1|tara:strand:- start:2253 stop:2771 length:519 start_codon:yes stop_codon:yes gene_type:complete
MKLLSITFISLSLSLNIYSEDLTDIFNSSLNNPNISFIQSSINPYTNSIDKSEGRIIRNKDKTIVFVDTPFKEKYELTKNEIIITDIELDQQSIISREDFGSNIMMNIFLNGLDMNNPNYIINYVDNSIFVTPVIESGYGAIEVKFKDNKIYYLKYNDNLDIENLIFLKIET